MARRTEAFFTFFLFCSPFSSISTKSLLKRIGHAIKTETSFTIFFSRFVFFFSIFISHFLLFCLFCKLIAHLGSCHSTFFSPLSTQMLHWIKKRKTRKKKSSFNTNKRRKNKIVNGKEQKCFFLCVGNEELSWSKVYQCSNDILIWVSALNQLLCIQFFWKKNYFLFFDSNK